MMIFDDNVLNIICRYIDDVKTFAAFSITCKKTHNISKLHVNQKMDKFVTEKSDVGTGGAIIVIVYKYLPNRLLHGIQSCQSYYQNLESLELKLYHKGYLLARYDMDQREIDDDGNDNIMVDETRVLNIYDINIYSEEVIIEKMSIEIKLHNTKQGFTRIEYLLNHLDKIQTFYKY